MSDRQTVEPILVAVLGNEFAAEDALGPRVGRELARRHHARTQVLDLGINVSRLLDELAGRELLIIVDAIAAGPGSPGVIIDCAWGDVVAALAQDVQLSTHGLSIAEQMRLAKSLGLLPPVCWFVGVTLTDFALGDACGEPMSKLARQAAEYVIRVIKTFRAEAIHA